MDVREEVGRRKMEEQIDQRGRGKKGKK